MNYSAEFRTPSENRPPRRVLQFSLRGLLLLVLLVAVFLGGRASVLPLIEAERARAKAAQQRADEISYEMRLQLHEQREIVHALDNQLQASQRVRARMDALHNIDANNRLHQGEEQHRDATEEQAQQRQNNATGP